MQKPYTYTTELYGSFCHNSVIRYVTRDNGVYPLTVNLTSYGKPFAIPDGAAAEICVLTASGANNFIRAGAVSGGSVSYTFNAGDLPEAGTYFVSITLIEGENRLTWPTFSLKVMKSLKPDTLSFRYFLTNEGYNFLTSDGLPVKVAG